MIHIIGGGLAGSEAAWQASRHGVPVTLYEMRPVRPTAVHHTDRLAELVCSNSFRADQVENAVGLLKEEMRRLGSLVIRVADETRVPAGGALAVDRVRFAQGVTAALEREPLVTIRREEVGDLSRAGDPREPVIVATGPLTSPDLSAAVAALVGRDHLYFYDAISPIVLAESIDRRIAFRASRWGRDSPAAQARPDAADVGGAEGAARDAEDFAGGVDDAVAGPDSIACGTDDGQGDYLNCPMTAGEYHDFHRAVCGAELASLHAIDQGRFFEGCLPIEVMARRGEDTLRFGPMKPVGPHRPPDGAAAVRGGAASAGHAGRRSLQPGGVPDPDQVGRAEADLPHDSRPRAGRVRAVRHDPPQHLHQRAGRPAADVAVAASAGTLLRGPDLGRRGLRGVRGERPRRRAQRGRARAGARARRATADHRHRCVGPLRVARRRGGLPAVQHRVRADSGDRRRSAPPPRTPARGGRARARADRGMAGGARGPGWRE